MTPVVRGGEERPTVTIIGGGLAGSDAAWQAARMGVAVRLYEMRPVKNTPAHKTSSLAELVCSNSFRGDHLQSAPGLLKEEMAFHGSLIIAAARANSLPAGTALAVDREKFARQVTEAVASHPLITVVREEVTAIPEDGPVVIATGPLTSDALADAILEFTGEEALAFFDAAAPIVTYDSLNHDVVFLASRYDRGEAAYLNCPMNEQEYTAFWEALREGEEADKHDFERDMLFEGCLPVEELARRGKDTLRYGPLKPVGLTDPRTGREPYAVVQLRQDNAAGSLYNMVGFQTSLRWGEQTRIFRMIPGMEKAEFVRLGVMHRNTFINSPRLLKATLQSKKRDDLFFAGQVTGTEGYIESAAMGIIAGINAARLALGRDPLEWPAETAMGALGRYITVTDPEHFQPMNITFGLLPPPGKKVRGKRQRRTYQSERALETLKDFITSQLGEGALHEKTELAAGP